MKKKSDATLVMFFSALVGGQAIYYFVSGSNARNSTTWNILVLLQLVAAVGVLIWSLRKVRAPDERN